MKRMDERPNKQETDQPMVSPSVRGNHVCLLAVEQLGVCWQVVSSATANDTAAASLEYCDFFLHLHDDDDDDMSPWIEMLFCALHILVYTTGKGFVHV